MTDNMKKFAELLSKDEGAKKELEAALAKLSEAYRKEDSNDAAVKVAAKHGITLTAADFEMSSEMKELSADEMKAVAGGKFCDEGYWFSGECEHAIFW